MSKGPNRQSKPDSCLLCYLALCYLEMCPQALSTPAVAWLWPVDRRLRGSLNRWVRRSLARGPRRSWW